MFLDSLLLPLFSHITVTHNIRIKPTGYVAGTETMSIADLGITATLSTLIASNLIEDFELR